jgi:hypothetical protein
VNSLHRKRKDVRCQTGKKYHPQVHNNENWINLETITDSLTQPLAHSTNHPASPSPGDSPNHWFTLRLTRPNTHSPRDSPNYSLAIHPFGPLPLILPLRTTDPATRSLLNPLTCSHITTKIQFQASKLSCFLSLCSGEFVIFITAGWKIFFVELISREAEMK